MAKLVVESLGVDMLYSGCGDPVFSPTPKNCQYDAKGKRNVNAFALELFR